MPFYSCRSHCPVFVAASSFHHEAHNPPHNIHTTSSLNKRLTFFRQTMTSFTTNLANFLAVCSLASALGPADTTNAYPTFLPIKIPVDRAFDLQWNPPGYPQLEADFLAIPWGDRANDDPWGYYDSENDQRTGQYAFLEGASDDNSLSFVRTEENGSYVQIFKRVQFLLISDDILMFNGDPHEDDGFPAGGGFGTIIKAPSIPAGDASGVYDTVPLDESGMSKAKEWLLKNFGVEKSSMPIPSLIVTLPGHIGDEGNDIVFVDGVEDSFMPTPSPTVPLPDNIGDEGYDVVHDDEFMVRPPYDDDSYPDTGYSPPIRWVCGNSRSLVGLGAIAITFIVLGVVAVVVTIVIFIVKRRKRRKDNTESDETSMKKTTEEGSDTGTDTCEDTESIAAV